MRTVTRLVALRRADLDGGQCPVPDECVAALRDGAAVLLNRHPQEAAPADGVLEGIAWPPDFHPGVLVTVSWSAARNEVTLRTTPLEEPMRVDGVDYFHEYDPAVATRECPPGTSNRGKVLHAVRRMGRVFDDGSAVFAESELTRKAGLGRGTRGLFLLRNAVEQLIREGFVTRVPGSVDRAGVPSYPAVEGEEPADMLFYAPLIEPAPTPGAEPGERREHWVNGFLRRLPEGSQPSQRQRALHERITEGAEELAPGYTFVKKHHRNG
ncbi:hypothetical protein [Dactylosporangium salmoneum]|uniref:Uncharacterized protein n=1 Tax=Dactylosporangium salmoneum TaxID=53361 RepID=A0ABP5UCZ1_9ACTN